MLRRYVCYAILRLAPTVGVEGVANLRWTDNRYTEMTLRTYFHIVLCYYHDTLQIPAHHLQTHNMTMAFFRQQKHVSPVQACSRQLA